MRQKRRITAALVLTALVAAGVGSAITMIGHDSHWSYAADSRRVQQPPHEPLQHAQSLSGAFKFAAQAIQPSVVSIRSVKEFKATRRSVPRPELPEEFRDFFGDDFFDRFEMQPRAPEGGFRQQGQGTGVIVSEDGYIVTNNHVVRGADEVKVTLMDERSFQAEIVGTDPKTDVAVLKIDANDLTAAALGDSDAIEVGDWVIAAGTPFGLEKTITAGIISAKGRAGVGIVEYEDFIQTDASINPGNSGGPLVNLRGEVIGINTAIASRSGSFAGVGFSIPSNMVRMIMDDILDDGKVERGWLGAVIQNLDEDLAESFGYDSTEGVLIGQVVPDSPADKAGLKAGDIVIEYKGERQRDANSFRNAVAATKPNTRSELVVMRDGQRKTLTIAIGLLDDEKLAAAAPLRPGGEQEDASESVSELGVKARTLTPELARQLKLDEDLSGVVVTEVEPGSLAQRAGLREKDVVISVNGKRVETLAAFQEVTKEADVKRGLRLHVSTDGFQRFLFIKQG